MSGKTYEDATVAMRVIADHLRGAALPGRRRRDARATRTQCYVMRRLVRRAMRYAFELELTGGLAEKLVPVVAEHLQATSIPRSATTATTSSRC